MGWTPPVSQSPLRLRVMRMVAIAVLAVFYIFALVFVIVGGSMIGSKYGNFIPGYISGILLALGFMLGIVTTYGVIGLLRNQRSTLVGAGFFLLVIILFQFIAPPVALSSYRSGYIESFTNGTRNISVTTASDRLAAGINDAISQTIIHSYFMWQDAPVAERQEIEHEWTCCGFVGWPFDCYGGGFMRTARNQKCLPTETRHSCCARYNLTATVNPNVRVSATNASNGLPDGDVTYCGYAMSTPFCCVPPCAIVRGASNQTCSYAQKGCVNQFFQWLDEEGAHLLKGALGVSITFGVLELIGLAVVIAQAVLLFKFEQEHGGAKAGKGSFEGGGGGAAPSVEADFDDSF